VVDAALSSPAADGEEATEDEEAVDVAVLVADAIFGVVDAAYAAAVLDADVAVDAAGVLEAAAEVSGRGEVVEAVSAAAR
jgi:hypothetical protein